MMQVEFVLKEGATNIRKKLGRRYTSHFAMANSIFISHDSKLETAVIVLITSSIEAGSYILKSTNNVSRSLAVLLHHLMPYIKPFTCCIKDLDPLFELDQTAVKHTFGCSSVYLAHQFQSIHITSY